LVLKILSRRPQLHGYAIMAAMREASGDVLRAEDGLTCHFGRASQISLAAMV
jgi:hypothetical protein